MKNENENEIDKSKFWNSDRFYQKELERIWSNEDYGHPPDLAPKREVTAKEVK